jgi:putative phosphoesterase
MASQSLTVGLISDTHGLLRSEAEQALRGVERIVHAGDICDPRILEALARIAPVTAVRGNNDRGPWAERLPLTDTLTIGAVRLLVIHDLATLAVDPRACGIRVVIAGHSHRPRVETRDGVLYVNPGSAGPRRFRLPISLGFLTVRDSDVSATLTELEINPPEPCGRPPTGAGTRSSRPSRPKAGACARSPRR